MALSVLITGGGGVLGRRLRPLLEAAGYDVISCGRTAGDTIDAVWDVAADDGPRPACRADIVVHAAAAIGGYGEPLDSELPLAEVNVDGTLRVARWCIRHRVRRLVYISSASVYGSWDERPKRETDQCAPWAAGLYAVTKHCGEQVARLVEPAGVELTILRLASLFGPEYSGSLIHRLLIEGAPRQRIAARPPHDDAFDLLHVADAARTVASSVGFSGSGLWNVGGGELTSIRQLAESCARLTGAEVDFTDETSARPRRIINWVDDRSARRDLGHTNLVPLREGIRAIADDCAGKHAA